MDPQHYLEAQKRENSVCNVSLRCVTVKQVVFPVSFYSQCERSIRDDM